MNASDTTAPTNNGHACTLQGDYHALCDACHGMLGRLAMLEARLVKLERDADWLRRCCRDSIGVQSVESQPAAGEVRP